MIHEPDGNASIRTEDKILNCIEKKECQFNFYKNELTYETTSIKEEI